MKNRLTDLNDHLFMQLERLSSESLAPEAIDAEVRRSEALVHVADRIVENARLQLRACELVAEHGDRFAAHLPMIASSSNGSNGNNGNGGPKP